MNPVTTERLTPHVSTTTPSRDEPSDYVEETRFGAWFLGTDMWLHFVIKVAVLDLTRLMGARKRAYPVVVDVGCGRGQALRLLKMFFRASRLVGVDMDAHGLDVARRRVARHRLEVELLENACTKIDLPDASVDLVFCHQTLHHLVHQEKALDELYRILKPGGVLLLSESTREYIHSWVIKLLFAHPMDVQKTSDEYLALLRRHGFEFDDDNVSYPYLWWSRWDFGILEALGIPPRKQGERVETLVNVAARKPG